MSSSQAQPPPGVDPTKFARRAIGRSPEEHAALERVLAERRRRRGLAGGGSGGSGSGSSSRARSRSPRAGPSEGRADLAQQRRALERREREFEQQQREHLLRLEVQEHDLQQRRLRQERQLAAQERELATRAQAQRVIGGLPEIDEDQALLALPVAQRRAAILAPFGVTGGRRRAKGKSKGAGWHKRGYRDDGGYMRINVKEGEECTKGRDVYEGSTLAEFVREVQGEYRYLWILSVMAGRSLIQLPSCRFSRRLRLWVSSASGYHDLGPALPQEISSTAPRRS